MRKLLTILSGVVCLVVVLSLGVSAGEIENSFFKHTRPSMSGLEMNSVDSIGLGLSSEGEVINGTWAAKNVRLLGRPIGNSANTAPPEDASSLFKRTSSNALGYESLNLIAPISTYNLIGIPLKFSIASGNVLNQGIAGTSWNSSCKNITLSTPAINKSNGKMESTFTADCTTTVPELSDLNWRANVWFEIVVGSKKTKKGALFTDVGRSVTWNESIEEDCVAMALWTAKVMIWMTTNVTIEDQHTTTIWYEWWLNDMAPEQSSQVFMRTCPSSDERVE